MRAHFVTDAETLPTKDHAAVENAAPTRLRATHFVQKFSPQPDPARSYETWPEVGPELSKHELEVEDQNTKLRYQFYRVCMHCGPQL